MPRWDVQLQQKQTGYLLTPRRRSEVALTIESFSSYTWLELTPAELPNV